MFSPSEKIKEYLEHCVKKHDLTEYISLNHRVIRATWNENDWTWNVDKVNQLINASGILNN